MSPGFVELIDLQRYPVTAPAPARERLVRAMRAELDADGCAILKGFVRSGAPP